MLLKEGAHRQQQQLIPLRRAARLRRVHLHQGSGPGPLRKLNFIAGGPLPNLLRPNLPVQQAGIEQLPQHGQALLIPPAQGLHIPPLHALLVQLLPQPGQHLCQLGGVDGL